MNREILFRGKNPDYNEWVYGGAVHQTDYYGDKCDKWFIVDGTHTKDYAMGDNVEVLADTVCQYTGLLDKNGQKIFEGDIVDYNGTNHEVIFENRFESAYFGIVISDMETWGFNNLASTKMMKIVGNIFDNPELLEVQE